MISVCLLGLLAAALAFVLPACRKQGEAAPDTAASNDITTAEEKTRPDVLLVSIDTLRWDHCSLYGYERKTTPQLERIAAEGILFESAYAPTATTAPSHATLFTGLYPYSHGVLKNGYEMSQKNVVVSEIFKKLGYKTAAFASSMLLRDKMGYSQGYTHYIFGAQNKRTADVTADDAIVWLDKQDALDRDPVFLWVHLRDPHEPYNAPESFGDPFNYREMEYASYEQMVARYDTEIAFSDHHLGRIVDRLEAMAGEDGALMVITADHGESFLEHGWRGHGAQIYEENIRVPLVIRWKGHLEGGKVIKDHVGLVDMLPTMLGLIGSLPDVVVFQGVDLTPLITDDGVVDAERYLFFQRRPYETAGVLRAKKLGEFTEAEKPVIFGEGIYVAGDKYAVRFGKWKYLEATEEELSRELYDVVADPDEKANLADQHPDIVKECSREIGRWRRETVSFDIAPKTQGLTAEQLENLAALGYLEPEVKEDDELDEDGKKGGKRGKDKRKKKQRIDENFIDDDE